MAQDDAKKKEEEEKKSGFVRKFVVVLFFALAGFAAIDGYINQWGFARSLLYRHALKLSGLDGSAWTVKARADFEIVEIADISRLLSADSLSAFDQPYREKGFYRVYFRLSDSSSTKLQKIFQTLSTVDTGETIKHSIEDMKKAYQNLRRILKMDTTKVRDTVKILVRDSTGKIGETKLMGSETEVVSAMSRLLKNPQVMIGVTIGVAASAGVELLQGSAYLVLAKNDVFRFEMLNVGTRTGEWEGRPIDILWAFAKEDTSGKYEARNPKP